MKLTRGRVIRRETNEPASAAVTRPLGVAGPRAEARARRVVREEMEGRDRAEALVRQAQERADAVTAHARAQAHAVAAEAAREAQAAEQAKLAAVALALKKAEADRAERDVDRAIALAVVLAERLIGASLAVAPEQIATLAAQALAEARGVRRARILAHPADAEALRQDLTSLGLSAGSVEIQVDEGLARGELTLHTDLGTLDARLTPRLERLAAALRDALR